MPDTATPPIEPTNDDQPQQSIPYSRFKAILDRAKAAETELATLKATPAQQPPNLDSNTPQPTGDNSPTVPDVSPQSDQDYAALQSQHDAVAAELASLKLARARDRACVAAGLPLELAGNLTGDTDDAIQRDAERLKGYIGSKPTAPNIDGDTAGRDSRPIFTSDQLADSKFYAANRTAILRAGREGRLL